MVENREVVISTRQVVTWLLIALFVFLAVIEIVSRIPPGVHPSLTYDAPSGEKKE